MNRQHLQDSLQKLHSELQQIDSIDVNERRLLQSLISDINELIDAGGKTDSGTEQLTERLRDGITLFEASHPQATLLMGQVIDALAKLGI
jgi:hypothetical protein